MLCARIFSPQCLCLRAVFASHRFCTMSLSKKQKVIQKYKQSYNEEWPCLSASKVSENHVFCSICCCDISIAHGGRDDCRRHVQSKKHQEYCKVKSNSKSVASFFIKNDDNSVINAELLFSSFLVEHNVPIAAADHAGQLFRSMFPDSQIAKKFACGRTKTTALIKCMADKTKNDIIQILQSAPFALSTDGSTDFSMSSVKLYPTVVSYYDANQGRICSSLLSLLESSDNSGEGIFNILENDFKKKGIPWRNCLAFACDNANIMIGCKKGVLAFIKKVQPSVYLQGCSCHLLHIAAQKASSCFMDLNVEQLLIQIYYFLQKSSKRKNCLKLCQAVCGTKPHKILKHVNTRWLSFLESVNRLIEQFEALEHFFSDENEDFSNVQVDNIKSHIQNPSCKLYCLFLSNILPLFVSTNMCLLREAPQIHLLQRILVALFTDLIVRFVKPAALKDDNSDMSILNINFQNRKNQKDDSELVIGASTRAYILEKELSESQMSQFYSNVREFYKAGCEYILKKMPINSEFLKHAEIVDVLLRKKISFSSVQYMISRFDSLSIDPNQLEIEFSTYQFFNFDAEIFAAPRMDVAWDKISRVQDESGVYKFKELSKLMLAILLIPHSNAATERIFSIVRKNQTEFRPNLSTDTLNALLVQKVKSFTQNSVCHQNKFSHEDLASAKHATKLTLSGHMEN